MNPVAGVPWAAVEASLRQAHRSLDSHKLSPWMPDCSRRAAVAVLLRGDAHCARELLLVHRSDHLRRHPGELAFPGGMAEPEDRDLPATARRELQEELGIAHNLWELGCFPDGVAKGAIRFTPVLFRWEEPEPRYDLQDREVQRVLLLPLVDLLAAPWKTETLIHHDLALEVPRLELAPVPLWGATAFVLKAWLDVLALQAGIPWRGAE